MFQGWGFLISEMFLLIVLAALLGVFVGWIVWGRRGRDARAAEGLRTDLATCRAETGAVRGDLAAAKADLEACKAAGAEKDARVVALEREIERAEALVEAAEAAAMEAVAESVAVAEAVEADHGAHPVHPDADARDFDGDGVVEGTDEGVRPATLTGPRGGVPDDLKQIRGIGPKLEQLCNELGFYHFDQIAAWTADEVAWVDANLKGFKGRVSRDNWVEQAKVLAAGGTTEFAQKVKKGGVYDS